MKARHRFYVGIALGLFFTPLLFAEVLHQGFENFSLTSPPNAPTPQTVGDWSINDIHISTGALGITPYNSSTNMALLPDLYLSGISGTNSFIKSPELVHGVGSISFYLHNRIAGNYICELQTSTNGTDWLTTAVITNTAAAWTNHTVEINSYVPTWMRIFRSTSLNNGSWLAIDAISTTEAPAKTDISDLQITPNSPENNDSVFISALLSPSSLASNINATLYWSADGGTSNTISMATNTLSNGRYETVIPITNQPAFTVINYAIIVDFEGPDASSPATASGNFFFRQSPPQSSYTNVQIKGGFTHTLELVEDHYWTAAQAVVANSNATLYFETLSGGTTEWRDPAPSGSVLPLSGTLTSGAASDMGVDRIDPGWLLYSFDEAAGTYAVEQADYQSFNSWTSIGSYTTVVQDGWSITRARAVNAPTLAHDGYALQFQNTTSERAIAAPALTNGIGFIQFQYRNTDTNGLAPASFQIQTKASSGDTWASQDTVSGIISPDYLFYRLAINRFEWKYIRLVATGPATGQLLIDNLAVSTLEYPANVTIVDHGITPSSPRADETVTFFAELDVTDPTTGTNAAVTLSSGGTPLADLELTYNATSNRFEATLPTNLPSLAIIDYDLQVTFTGPHAGILSPVNTTGDFYLRAPVPQSPYSSVTLKGGITNALEQVADGYWIGIEDVTPALGQTDVTFETSNGVATNIWSDPDPLRTNLPIFGAYATNFTDNIRIAGSDTGWLLVTFDESLERYGIQQADYQSFNTWSGFDATGTTTVQDNWTISRALAINDPTLAHDAYALQFQDTTSERAIESPELTDGIGTLTFRYRNTETDLLHPAAFVIQVRAATNLEWQTVETVEEIVSPDYLYHSVSIDSIDLRFVRIAALEGTAQAQLLIDEMIITRPGATVIFSNLDHTPQNPFITNTVEVSVDIAVTNGASINAVTLWFRGGTNGIYDPISMTNTLDNRYTGTIPRGARGEMQYYVAASYLNPATGGYQTANDPTDRTGISAIYSNTNTHLDSEGFENFSLTSPPNAPTPQTVGDWSINDIHISTGALGITPYNGSTNMALLPDLFSSGISGTNSFIKSPELVHGVGSISFYLHNRVAGDYICELQTSTNGTDWLTTAVITNTAAAWTSHTVEINSHVPTWIRIFRSTSLNNGSWLAVDAISLTYPPVYVTASDFEMHPAYASQEEPTTISCTIESATSYHPAFNISGDLQYRYRMQQNGAFTSWSTWYPVAMTRSGSQFSADIPALPSLSEVEYYVESNFKGYSAEGEDQSPMTFPEEVLEYGVRRYISAYSNVTARIGTNDVATFEQAGNGTWEAVITFIDPTNQPAIGIDGYGYYDGTAIDTGLPVIWGDNTQTRPDLPLADTATIGASPIIIPETNAVGQFIFRFDENSGLYTLQRGVFQDFENWPADDERFEESFAAAEITQHIQDFAAWPLSDVAHAAYSDDFEAGRTNVYDYPDNWTTDEVLTGGENVPYVIRSGIVITQLVGQAGLLGPTSTRGYLYNDSPTVEGVGSFSFDLRCASPNDFRPAIYDALTNDSIMISARIKANDMPTNAAADSVGFAYTSIIGAYSDTNNYYELRIAQTDVNNRRFEIWQKNGGTLTMRKASGNLGNSITKEETVSFVLYRESTRWRLRGYLGNSSKVTEYSSGTPLAGKGIGLNAMDASPSVGSVNVYSVNSINYSIANPIYTNDFSSTPEGWDDNGVWTVSDGRYTRPGYTGAPITARVEFSPTAEGAGTVIESFTNLTHTAYRRYTAYPERADTGYIRIRNYTGNGYLIVDNVVRTEWRGETINTNGWLATNVWINTAGATDRGMELRNSHAVGGAGQEIQSPTLDTGASVIAFDYKPHADATGTVAFAIDYQQKGFAGIWYSNLVTKTDISAPTDWDYYSFSIPDRELRPDIARLRIRNLTAGKDDGLLIDNVVVTEPPPFTNSTWWGYNVLVTESQPDGIVANADSPWLAHVDGNRYGAFINNSQTNGTGSVTNNEYMPFIQSAYLSEGIGEIRFLYRAWDENASQIQIIASTNRLAEHIPLDEWDVLDTVVVNSTAYQEYYDAIFERDYRYVALRVNSLYGTFGRVGVDNVLITAPLAADLRLSNIRTVPAIPLPYEDVWVEVTVDDLFFSPSGIELDLLHRTGTNNWGNHDSSIRYDMHVEEDYGTSFVFRSDFPIPGKAAETVVQYQVEATFGGFFADQSSPKYLRQFENPDHYWPIDLNADQTNRTPYFIVFSSLPGQVWINEFNILDGNEYAGLNWQYIELAGVGSTPLGNWRVESIKTDFNTNASYTIGSDVHLDGLGDEFGFYVLAQTNVTPRDIDLTNALPASGGIQLIRPLSDLGMEVIEQQVAYDTFGSTGQGMVSPDNRFVYVGFDDDWDDFSLSMTGSGSNLTDFATNWVNTTAFSVGTTNFSQTLIPWPTNEPPVGPGEYTGSATIGTASLDAGTGKALFSINTEAIDLVPSVWYVTNLFNITSTDWRRQTNGFGYTRSGTTYNIACDHVTPPVFYRIKVNRAP